MASQGVKWLVVLSCGVVACAERLPSDVEGYRDDCILMNAEPIGVTSDDPHEGEKNVYACDVACERINQRPLPDGTLIVKESTRTDSDYPWLIATARKVDGKWQWDEYTRNFEDEDFVSIPASEDVCIDCHRKWEADDWIVTYLDDESVCD